MAKTWVDVPEGWRYNFPLIYDDSKDGNMLEWIYDNGYPRNLDIPFIRQWSATKEETDEN